VSLVNVLIEPEVAAGKPDNWKMQRVRFELKSIAFAALAALFAWLAGKPMRERITAIIVSATTDNSPARSEPE
jgi:hypothetical protein